jgi:hypothetical protein
MANMLFANNCNTTLNGGITAVATSMVVTSATGFPSPTGSQYFYCTLADAATQTTIEIVKVTAVSGTTFTIVRGQDGTTGTIFASGAVVSLRLVRASLNDFPKLDEDNTFTGLLTANSFASSNATITGGTLNGVAIGGTTAGDGTFDVLTANVTNLTNVTSSAGIVITGTFSGSSPTDGLVMDYATGWGRFSDFGGDGFQWYNAGVANTKLMQLSSSGVITTATWNGATVGTGYGGTGLTSFTSGGVPYATSTSALTTNGSLQFSGQVLGVGNTANSWTAAYRVLQLGVGASILGRTDDPGLEIGENEYRDVTTGNRIYLATQPAAMFHMYSGSPQWFVAPSGTAGNTITFTQAMTLFNSGGLSLGNTTDPGATNLSVTGIIKIGSNQAVNGPAFSAYKTGQQTGISYATWTKVQFPSKNFDTASAFDSTTNYRFTPLVAGYYQLNATVYINTLAVGGQQIAIYKNGSQFSCSSETSTASTDVACVVSAVIYLNGSTDYVEVYVIANTASGTYQTNGGGGGGLVQFSGAMVRGA